MDGTIVKSEIYDHVTDTEMQNMPFASWYGTYGSSGDLSGLRNRPVKLTTITQATSAQSLESSDRFFLRVESFDALAQPVTTRRYSSQGHSRSDQRLYQDGSALWTLGLVRKLTNLDSGLVESQTDYDATTALPLKVHAFGRLQQTLTYNADGTLASVSDGRDGTDVDTTVTLSSWKRGIPQLILHPATADQPSGALQSAVVDDLGQITSVTDENDFTTSYGYDAMGRLSSIRYPDGDNVGWNPVTLSFQQIPVEEHGLPAGHWRSSRYEGNHHYNAYYDAMWRPVLEERFDVGTIGATLSQVVKRYDASGRLAFQSYPARGVGSFLDPALTGVRTEYDALDRVTAIRQDSELGVLTTAIAYLPGFRRQTTNPRNQVTTERFQVFDVPSFDFPVQIDLPENVRTTIARDVFGKPLSVGRGSGG
ncbi:MAG: RHS repeat domain-containing protein [Luteimonas sp.]